MNTFGEIDGWPDRLTRCLDAHCRHLRTAHVVTETESTQDAAVRMCLEPGEIVVAGRQLAGRGRLGRRWHDPDGLGIAMTIVHDPVHPPRLAAILAVGVAIGLEEASGEAIGIKWPNDLLMRGKKVSGILIERSQGTTRIGIGVNVSQKTFGDPELDERAISLGAAGHPITRIDVLEAILPAIDAAMGWSDDAVDDAYAARDVLSGRTVTLAMGTTLLTRRVVDVRPGLGVCVEDPDGAEPVWLPASTTSVKSIHPDSDKEN